MNRPCPIAIHCGDYPFANLSSEGPEPDWVPPIGEYWTSLGYCCEGTPKLEYSTVSQLDADLALDRTLEQTCPDCPPTLVYCADASCPDGSNLATICVPTSQEDADALAAAAAAAMLPFCDGTPPPYSATCACPDGVTDVHTVYSDISQAVAEAQCEAIPKNCGGDDNPGTDVCNTAQTCCVPCPDGTIFCYTVAACTIYSDTVENANAQAYALACIEAEKQKICLGPIDRCCCVGDSFDTDIVMSTAARAASWSVADGALPDGLALSAASSDDGRISIVGTPTTSGNFAFSIRATDANGNYAQQNYEIDVIEVTTTALDDWQTGVAYSFQMQASGGSGNYQWSIQSGALPDGLTMDDDGLISGTPTGADSGSMPILFAVVDLTCEAALKSKFLPRAQLTTTSITTTKTKRGFYGFGANSGTLYKRLDVEGEHTQTALTSPLVTPASIGLEFCGGAKQTYSGYTQLDLYGNVINLHNKDLTVACSNEPYPNVTTPIGIDVNNFYWGAVDNVYSLLGYCWTDDPQSCDACDDDETNWISKGNYATARSFDIPYDMLIDDSLFTTTDTVLTYSGEAKSFYDRITIGDEVFPTGFPSGTTNVWNLAEPWIRISSTGDFTLTLSDPYTDAEAESTKSTISGGGAIADGGTESHASIGYINHDSTRTTAVAFVIDCSNLIPAHSYLVSYQLWNLTTNAKITVTETITALTDTYQVTGNVPTPSAGSQIKISKASIIAI